MGFCDGMKVTGTFRAPPEFLADPGVVAHFLRNLTESIGMTALGHHIYDVPIAVKRLGQDPLADEGGVTGITVLSTSHAAIHTWPEESGARIDVDSCRAFDPEVLVELLRGYFNAYEIQLFDVSRCFRGSSVGLSGQLVAVY